MARTLAIETKMGVRWDYEMFQRGTRHFARIVWEEHVARKVGIEIAGHGSDARAYADAETVAAHLCDLHNVSEAVAKHERKMRAIEESLGLNVKERTP